MKNISDISMVVNKNFKILTMLHCLDTSNTILIKLISLTQYNNSNMYKIIPYK